MLVKACEQYTGRIHYPIFIKLGANICTIYITVEFKTRLPRVKKKVNGSNVYKACEYSRGHIYCPIFTKLYLKIGSHYFSDK